jgi:hypothetical protein
MSDPVLCLLAFLWLLCCYLLGSCGTRSLEWGWAVVSFRASARIYFDGPSCSFDFSKSLLKFDLGELQTHGVDLLASREKVAGLQIKDPIVGYKGHGEAWMGRWSTYPLLLWLCRPPGTMIGYGTKKRRRRRPMSELVLVTRPAGRPPFPSLVGSPPPLAMHALEMSPPPYSARMRH